MEITEVRVKLVDGWQRDKLKAYCSITIDDAFVVRDLKIIEGTRGLFVAMPSRKLTVRCPKCGSKTQARSRFCSDCGGRLPEEFGDRDGRTKLHADIAHPINAECREAIQNRVLDDYELEVEAAGAVEAESTDYESAEFDEGFEDDATEVDSVRAGGRLAQGPIGGSRFEESGADEDDEFARGLDDRARSDRGRPAAASPSRAERSPADLRRTREPAANGTSEFDNFDNFSDGLFGS